MSFPLHETLRSVVLIADDDPTIRLLVREALEPTGLQVEEAEDGAQALDILKIMRADLILLDVTMPKKNGFEVCSALRNSSQYASLPVLMVTGLDDPPLHLLLGHDVLAAFRHKLAELSASIDAWESVTKDVNLPNE